MGGNWKKGGIHWKFSWLWGGIHWTYTGKYTKWGGYTENSGNPGDSANVTFLGWWVKTWPFKRRIVTSNQGIKRSRLESPGLGYSKKRCKVKMSKSELKKKKKNSKSCDWKYGQNDGEMCSFLTMVSWSSLYLDVSKNRGTPKWTIENGKPC